MTLSADGLQAALAQWTDEVFLECLTFEHSTLATPIRLVNDRQDLARTAGTFTAFPFGVQLHQRTSDSIATARITADNVDQRIITELRAIQTPRPTVTYELVLASSPNTVEQGPIEFEILGFVADAVSISLEVSFALGFLNQAFPKDFFGPANSGD